MIPKGGILTILTTKPKGKCIHFSHYFIFQLTTSFAFPLPKELPFEEINEKENVNFYRGVHGKKLAFTVRKTKIEFKENGAFYKRLPTFCVRKIQHFLCVFVPVNPSICFIIR